MNKQIRELAEQASEYASTMDMTGEYLIAFDQDKYSQKFAELIIKECQVALKPMLRDMISRGQAYDLIKKHFGVK